MCLHDLLRGSPAVCGNGVEINQRLVHYVFVSLFALLWLGL